MMEIDFTTRHLHKPFPIVISRGLIMELGGKSQQIILQDTDLNLAVNGVAGGIFPTTGQSCISGSRLLVHRGHLNAFSEKLVGVASRACVGDPNDPATQIGPIANRAHYENVLRDIDEAIRIAEKIEAGTIYINNYFNATTQSPVGGYKQSGYGCENGFEGMRCFMQTKSVWVATNPYQPYLFVA